MLVLVIESTDAVSYAPIDYEHRFAEHEHELNNHATIAHGYIAVYQDLERGSNSCREKATEAMSFAGLLIQVSRDT